MPTVADPVEVIAAHLGAVAIEVHADLPAIAVPCTADPHVREQRQPRCVHPLVFHGGPCTPEAGVLTRSGRLAKDPRLRRPMVYASPKSPAMPEGRH